MPVLAREQENTSDILNWFVISDGILTDAYEIGYQIYDITGGFPGTQIFPATPGDWEDVANAPGNFDVGSYYAYDNTSGSGYTPPVSASLGTHRICWRWKVDSASSYQQIAEDFEILEQQTGSLVNTYINVQDVRNVGLTDTSIYPDSLVLSSIELWQELLDRACRQWFLPKILTLQIDGTNSDTIHFGVPIIGLEYLKLNNSDTALDTGLYEVYNGIKYPDDRRNPRVKLIRSDDCRNIYVSPFCRIPRFRKGRKNQTIKGIFGFVEEDLSPPKLIKRALLKLVIEKITKPPYVEDPGSSPTPPPPIIGSLTEEWTDGHRMKYAQSGAQVSKRSPYMTGITNDQEIIEIIKMYRAPIGCATPAHWGL